MRGTLAIAAALMALLASPGALAAEGTPEDDALAIVAAQQGPLAMSADGHWRVYVDAHEVLHRVDLADPSRSQSIALPAAVHVIAASRTARKVALLTLSACAGRVDFGDGPGATAHIEWRPLDGSPSVASWLPTLPEACRRFDDWRAAPDVIAISADGRLVATEAEVTDVDAHRIVATLPRGPDHPLLMRFVDTDRQLLVVGAKLGESPGSDSTPSQLAIATWDLASRALRSLALRDLPGGGETISLLPAFVAGSGDVVTTALGPPRNDGAARSAVALELWAVGSCGASRALPRPIGDWTSIAVDPSGRWIAGTQSIRPDATGSRRQAGFTSELIVQDLATGKVLANQPWKHELQGLVANGDGTALFALVAPSSSRWATDPAKVPAAPPKLGEVVEFKLPAAALALAPRPATPWSGAPCPVANESPGARDVTHEATAIKPRWRHDVTRFVAPAPDGPLPAQAPAGSDYPCRGSCADVFVRTDSSMWVDDGKVIVQLHPDTGHAVRTLPTPRSAQLSSVLLAGSGGYFNAQGDTLTWRPFDVATDAAYRQVVDRRPGWQIILLQRQGNTILAAWQRKPPAGAPLDPTHEARPATYATYSTKTRLIREVQGTEDADGDAWPTSDDLQHTLLMRNLAPCNDETGALGEGHDWRIGPLDSVVAWACGPAPGAARIALWSDINATRPAATGIGDKGFARVVAADDAIGVIGDNRRLGHFRVFDADRRRELGTIDVPPQHEIVDVVADGVNGYVFVETSDPAQPGLRHVLAYAVR